MNITLTNRTLKVELLGDKPVPVRYEHKPSGQVFGGGRPDAVPAVNGASVPWERWKIKVDRAGERIRYRMQLPEKKFSCTVEFTLKKNELAVRIVQWKEPAGGKLELQLPGPMLTSDDPAMQYWRLCTSKPDMSSGGKMWQTTQDGTVGDAKPENEPRDVIHGTLWNNKLCVFVESNFPLFPIRHQLTADRRYSITLNPYRRRVRSRTLPLLEAKVVFLEDINGDGKADLSDYRLWLNRALPDGDPLYCKAVWYKIFMDMATTGVVTTFAQTEEIVRAIHNVTDGLPQVAYLVGCQEGGHDGAYPTLNTFNRNLGAPTDLAKLTTRCRSKWNAIISHHANLDDACKTSRDWDEEIVIPSGSPGQDALAVQGSVCHTRDTETGRVFKRLEAMRKVLPYKQTIHFDNTRITNTITKPHPDGIGVLEELVCGLMPVAAWLWKRGITITTEGWNGLPIEPTLLFSGFWHHDPPDSARQIYHRKIMGGGRGCHAGRNTTMDFGICNAIHQDFTCKPVSREALGAERWAKHFPWMKDVGDVPMTVSLEDNFPKMVDWIYRGVLLHHFYLEREMLAWDAVGQGIRMRFGDGVVADVCVDSPESLQVTWSDALIATRDERFIPRGNAIYAYSRTGCEREWVLPKKFRGRKLTLFTLTKDGRGPAPQYKQLKNKLELKLEPGVPVKIVDRRVLGGANP